MPRSYYPSEYFTNPYIDKPIEVIYEEYQRYTGEFLPDESMEFFHRIDFMVALPPLFYEGRFLKGLMLSQSIESINRLFPQAAELFVTMAHTMSPSYSCSPSADALLTLYENPHRNKWFKKQYPHLKEKAYIPLQDADFLSEYVFPLCQKKRDLDLICVTRLHDLKNIPFLATVLKTYREKYPQKKIYLTLVVGKSFDINLTGLSEHEQSQFKAFETILEHPNDYIRFIPKADFWRELAELYSRSKICVLPTLIEGKNRSLQEAMLCNTPILCNFEYNQYIRGETPIVPEGAGLYAVFDPEVWADKIHYILNHPDEFEPRRKYLEVSGRRNFLNIALDRLPYYAENLPGYVKGGEHCENLWLDLAIQDNYQSSLHEFLHGLRSGHSLMRTPEVIDMAIQQYARASRQNRPYNQIASFHFPYGEHAQALRTQLLLKRQAIEIEAHYWELVLSTRATRNLESIEERFTPEQAEKIFPGDLLRHIRAKRAKLKVLDVGCGPVSRLVYGVYRELIYLTAIDVMANSYRNLLQKYNLPVPHYLLSVFAEEASQVMGENVFDVVWCRNTHHQALSPTVFFEELVKTAKPGGVIIVETDNPGYASGFYNPGMPFHQYALDPEKRLMWKSDAPEEEWVCLSEHLPVDLLFADGREDGALKRLKLVWRKNTAALPPERRPGFLT